MSFQNRLMVRVVLPIRGGKRRYASVARTNRHIADRANRPVRFTPPRRLGRRVVVRRRDRQGWPVYVLEPADAPTRTGPILYFHGGSYVNEVTRWHWALAARLAHHVPCDCLLPIYPLGARPGAARVVATAAGIAAELIGGHGELVLAGDSAGGGLALATSLALRDRGLAPSRIVLISPWLDIRTDQPEQKAIERRDAMLAIAGLREAGRTYANGLALDDPRVSPLQGDLRGLAPITVFTGTEDLLNPDSHRLRERCAQAGVTCRLIEAPGMPHVYPLMPTPEGRNARRQLVELLQEGASGAAPRGREQATPAKGDEMGDRTQRLKGKTEEIKGRAKKQAGKDAGRPGTEARGAAKELKGKAKNAAGRASSGVKKATR